MYEQIYSWLAEQFAGNDVFAGLVGASAIGTALLLARSVPATLWRHAVRYGSVTLEIDNTDPGFGWIWTWLSRHPYVRRSRRLRLSGRLREVDARRGGEHEAWDLLPGEGRHVFLHRGRPVVLTYHIDQENSKGPFLRQRFHLRTVGRSQEFLRQLVAEAANLCTGDDRVRVYDFRENYWQLSSSKRPRTLDSVILPDRQAERLVRDAEWFFEAADWYAERGVPYRRGYLFSGPPGTGKSSVVLALASHMGKSVYALNLASVTQDSALMEAFAEVPTNAILLVEDIDAMRISKSRVQPTKEGEPPSVALTTLSGLLNAIDGVAAPEGRLLVMTSNHPEKLDPALIRPGRIDLHERFDLLGPAEVRRMFLRFHPGALADADRFAAIVDTPISPAELQCILLTGDPFGALDEIRPAIAPAAAE